ncbi:MAG: DUF3830 family protein [Candidatus Latescibacteria bacterium]|nr:DUF3830 family protein [Candidatus Latescibacterota bacterium]
MHKIRLIFPECDVAVETNLFEDKAPVSCKALWQFLEKPMETTLHNCWPALPELYFFIPEIEDLPYENPVIFATPGDLLLYHYIRPNGQKVFDIGIYYTKGYSLIEIGWLPGNGIGRIDENLEGLRKVIARAMLNGDQKLIVKRAE